MSEIKSLADQLKARLEEQRDVSPVAVPGKKEPARVKIDGAKVSAFIGAIGSFEMDGTEKMLIRIDKRTMNLLRRLKLASNIDMTRVIVFALEQFLNGHPWLNEYISQTLNKYEP